MAADDTNDITTAELARNISDFREDTRQAVHSIRNDMTRTIGQLSLDLDELGRNMAKGYVSQPLWEEVRRNQGERIGTLEQRMAKLEEASHNRYEMMQGRVAALDEKIAKQFADKDREAKADRRLIFTALLAPFLMLIVGMVLTAVFA